MEWTETLKRTVDYLEEHLLEDGAAESGQGSGAAGLCRRRCRA